MREGRRRPGRKGGEWRKKYSSKKVSKPDTSQFIRTQQEKSNIINMDNPFRVFTEKLTTFLV